MNMRWTESIEFGKQMVKIFDVKKLNSLGRSCTTTLADALARTYDWFGKNYADEGDGIRL